MGNSLCPMLCSPQGTSRYLACICELALSQLDTAPGQMLGHTLCAAVGSLAWVGMFIPSCGGTIPHGGKTSCILVVPLNGGSVVKLIQTYGEIPCGHPLCSHLLMEVFWLLKITWPCTEWLDRMQTLWFLPENFQDILTSSLVLVFCEGILKVKYFACLQIFGFEVGRE